MSQELRELLVRIESDLGLVASWGEIEDKGLAAQGVAGYGGKGKRWQFLLAGKDGSCMGTAVRLPPSGPGAPCAGNDPHVVKLTDELARKAWGAARKALGVKK